MATFGTMFKTVCSFTGFTAKREEVKLIAVVVLAVRAYSVEVFVHGCEGLRFGWGRGGGGGSHGGQFVGMFYEYTVVAVSGSVDSSACGHEVADGGFGKRSSRECTRKLWQG